MELLIILIIIVVLIFFSTDLETFNSSGSSRGGGHESSGNRSYSNQVHQDSKTRENEFYMDGGDPGGGYFEEPYPYFYSYFLPCVGEFCLLNNS